MINKLKNEFWFQEGPGVRNNQFKTNGIKLLNVRNILKNNKLDLNNTSNFLSKDEVDNKYKHFLCDEGDLVIASSGISYDEDGLLRTRGAIVEKIHLPLCMNTSTIRFKPKNKNNLNFLKYWLQSYEFRAQITKEVTGSAQKNFGPTHLKKLNISIPNTEKQTKAVKNLDIAENIVKLREQTIFKLDKLSESLLEEILSDKNNIIEDKKLGDACDVRDGTHDSPKYIDEGKPLITSKNLKDGFVDLSNVKFISDKDFNQINKRSKVDHKDILMPMIGTIGNPIYVNDIKPKFAIKNVALIKPKKNSPNQIYIKSLLENKLFLNYVKKVSRGGTQKFLGLGDIRKFPIPILKDHVENKIVSSINKIVELREKYLQDLTKSKKLIKSIQQQIFRVS